MRWATFTLHTEGSSDRVLLPVLQWILRRHDPGRIWVPQWADLTRLRRRPSNLQDKLTGAIELYPCDLLFVHRDQDRATRDERLQEIQDAAVNVRVPFVPVVPARTTEAWLLFDQSAIRWAAGNPNGRVPLSLPRLSSLESLPDPKRLLCDLLEVASELSDRRLEKLHTASRPHYVAERIEDFGPLCALSAFATVCEDVRAAVQRLPGR